MFFFRTCATPLALQAQRVGGSAQEMDAACRSALTKFAKAHKSAGRLQFWCIAATLLSTRLQRKDLQALWIAVAISEPARSFPRLALSLRQLLFARGFGGCSLSVGLPADHDSSGSTHTAVSSCCQCASMRVCPGTAPRVAKVPVRKSRDSGSPQREVHVPEWVALIPIPSRQVDANRHKYRYARLRHRLGFTYASLRLHVMLRYAWHRLLVCFT